MLLKRSIPGLAATAMLLGALACSPSDSDSYSAGDSARNVDLANQSQQTQYAIDDSPKPKSTSGSRTAGSSGSSGKSKSTGGTAVTPPSGGSAATPPAVDTRAIIPAGTRTVASLGSRVCTSATAGQKVTATLSDEIVGSNGAVIPAGVTVNLEVASTSPMTDSTKGHITFRVRSIESGGRTYNVVATATPISELQLTRTTKTSSDVKKVAGGAAAGAIIGQVIGKNTKGTVIGAAAGAAAGTAVALATGKYEGCVGERGALQIVLTNAIIVGN
jgi:hypothetical protein